MSTLDEDVAECRRDPEKLRAVAREASNPDAHPNDRLRCRAIVSAITGKETP